MFGQALRLLPNKPVIVPHAVQVTCEELFNAISSQTGTQMPTVMMLKSKCRTCDVLGRMCSVGFPHSLHLFITWLLMRSPVDVD